MSEVEARIREILGQKFMPQEQFVNELGKYVEDPHYWIGYSHGIIAEVPGKERSYYVLRNVLWERAEELRIEAERSEEDKLTTIKRYVQRKLGVASEDISMVVHYFLGLLGNHG